MFILTYGTKNKLPSTHGAETSGHPHTNINKSRHRPLHRNELKMDHRPKCEMQDHETPIS